MAIFPIRTFGDPVLRLRTTRVEVFDGALRRLVEDMIETMYDAPGVGLAAPQIGVSKRVCVFDAGEGPRVLVNPEIVDVSGMWSFDEGCLSVPGYYWTIERPAFARAVGQDLDGAPVEYAGEELLGRVLQHEIDHLNDIMYMDHLVAHTSLYKVTEQADGSEEDARYEAEDAADAHPVDGHEDASGHEHPHSQHTESAAEFDSMHRQVHEMRGDTAESGTVETSNRQ